MTSPSSTRAGTAASPGDRPHLPPVPTTSRRTGHKTPLGWLPWLLAGLLLLTLLATALVARAADGGSTSAASAEPDRPAAQNESTGAAAGQAAGSAATLSAGGQDLLALPGGKLSSLVDQRAEGAATVQSVVADEGFWIGPSAQNRVFVFLTPAARRSAGESGFQVKAGQTVQLAGTVKASSAELAQSAGVSADEGADQLVTQGGYVEATQVRLAG